MPIGSQTCPTCKGKRKVYRGHGRTIWCPDCTGGTTDSEMKRASAMNALAHCWSAYQKGETGDFNLELAVNGCLRHGYSLEELARKREIPMDTLRKAAGGQGLLSAE